MPTTAQYIAKLEVARDNLAQILVNQTAAWVIAGRPPVWSVDGESQSFESFERSVTDAITKLTDEINRNRVYWVRSRHRG